MYEIMNTYGMTRPHMHLSEVRRQEVYAAEAENSPFKTLHMLLLCQMHQRMQATTSISHRSW
jgi:hypothetical protein